MDSLVQGHAEGEPRAIRFTGSWREYLPIAATNVLLIIVTLVVYRFCAAAREHHFAALCTHPRFVPRMAELLKGCDVKSCAVIDFPAGDSTPLERAQQADRAVAEGADEIDVVMNYQAMLRGDFTGVRDDLMRVVRAVRGRAANDSSRRRSRPPPATPSRSTPTGSATRRCA